MPHRDIRTVSFTVGSGEVIRFTACIEGLLEEVNSGFGWEAKGVAEQIVHIPHPHNQLYDHRGMGGMLPADGQSDILRDMVELCELAGIPHNIEVLDETVDSVEFRAPSGDLIRFRAGEGCVEESVQLPSGEWHQVGSATQLVYAAASRALVDQTGAGGALPAENTRQLLSSLARVANLAGIPHNIPGTPSTFRPRASGRGGGGHHTRNRHGSIGDSSDSGVSSVSAYSGALDALEGSLLRPPPPGAHGAPRKRNRALLVGLCETPDRAVSRTIKKHHKYLSEHQDTRHVQTIQTLEADVDEMVTREDLLRGLEWLVEGSAAGTTLFLGIIGGAYTRVQAGVAGLELAGDDLFSYDDFSGFLESLPAGVKITIVCDVSPTVDVLELPFCSVCNEGGGYTNTTRGSGEYDKCRADIVMLSPSPASQTPQHTELGVFTAACIKVLGTLDSPSYGDVLRGVKVALGSVRQRGDIRPTLLPMLSSNLRLDIDSGPFHALGSTRSTSPIEAFDFGAVAGAPLPPRRRRPAPRVLASNVGSVRVPQPLSLNKADSLLSSISMASAATARNAGVEAGVKAALNAIYVKHNPTRLRCVDRFVQDYKGKYFSMMQLISDKYNDPTILSMYDPSWGP
eukprot:Rhum_TRINITY_DN15374_c1_g2::Rhum_TRINITY_DN15374_c1_g2_i1::g.153747::m.153747